MALAQKTKSKDKTKAKAKTTTPAKPAADTAVDASYAAAETNNESAFKWLLAWGLVLILILVFNRTRWGHTLIYYGLALSLLLLVLANYQGITTLLAPASGGAGEESTSPGPNASASESTQDQTTQPDSTVSPSASVQAPRFQINA